MNIEIKISKKRISYKKAMLFLNKRVNEVKNGYECGLSIADFNDIKVGDVIESFEIKEIKRKL